ncbi:MAG: hypothetical protein QM831_11345 [Kofleriaceae bacterium]
MKKIADALELLTAQHEHISARIAGLETLTGDALVIAVGEVADDIATHLIAEAEFRDSLCLADNGEDEVIHRCLANVFATAINSPEMRTSLRTLASVFRIHVANQDQEFMTLAAVFEEDMLAQLGTRLSVLADNARVVTAHV